MNDPTMIMMAASAALVGIGIASAATLRAWSGWLELKRLELDFGPSRRGGAKPEVAELKERVRKLEAIASGIEI
ncbi:MAG TPA: hypothetical protein VF662_01565 [Allosphingosinicella sp.]